MAVRLKQAVSLAALGVVFLPAAQAADWKLQPRLGLSERYTDNVNLQAGGNKKSTFITEVAPGVMWEAKGANMNVTMDYGLQGLLYSYDSSHNKVNQQLGARMRSHFLDDHFTLDGDARIDQRAASQFGAIGEGGYNTSGNLIETRSFSVTPGFHTRFGDLAKAEARLALTHVSSDNGGIRDTRGTDMHVGLNSGTAFHKVFWGLSYAQQESDNRTNSYETRNSRASVGYQFSPKFNMGIAAGNDENEGSMALRRISGNYWNVFMGWNPTLRTSVSANMGKRYDSDSFGLNLTHRTRRTTWALSYSESVMDVYQQLNAYAFDYYDCIVTAETDEGPVSTHVPVPNAGGTPPPGENCTFLGSELRADATVSPYGYAISGTAAPFPLNETFLNKAWNGTVSYRLRRNTFTLGLSTSRRQLLDSGVEDEYRSLTGGWAYHLGPRTQSTLSLSTSSSDRSTSGETADYTSLGWTMTHKFTPSATGGLEVRRAERSGSRATGDYSENSVAARLNMTF